ncbi:MAG TPA: tetratricopeptide repeat protein [Gemmataceae bacterium]|nr:tetratricopeptide repeat protein [Gemmataceae bacterium]
MFSFPAVLGLALVLSAPPNAANEKPAEAKMPLTGLARSKLLPNLCVYRYRVTTPSAECQAFVDQGLGFFYSYVWMEAARSFETATLLDHDCPMAWWGLSRALEKWGKGDAMAALKQAKELLPKADHREQMLINARLQEKGLLPGVGPEARKPAAQKTIDELLVLYDDPEAWSYRAQLSDGPAAIPYYKALLRLNPLHPGANHELVHYYENVRRPALGWPYAEKYIESSPGIPHPFHMQAHLATRLGRWDKTSDRSARAIELERAYHKEMNVKPSEDFQYSHHLEILTISLIHDGRYSEARKIEEEARKAGYSHWLPWFRLHLGERNWEEALKVIEHYRKPEKMTAAYLAALLYLKQGDISRATAEIDALRQAVADKRKDRLLEDRLNEVQGLLLCKQGAADEGLKLLQRVVLRTKDDFGHHAWGNGAYFMEVWGTAALETGRLGVAEEAYLEALAHDPGSVRAALGLQALCQKQGRAEEAERYGKLAQKFWQKADLDQFLALKQEYQKMMADRPQVDAGSGGER